MRPRNHLFRDLLYRKLLGISEIAGAGYIRRTFHQQFQSTDQIVDEAEAAGLTPSAVNRDRSASQGLHNEVRNDAAVVLKHTRAIGIENAGNLYLHSVTAVVIEEHCFRGPLAFVIASARPDRIDKTGIALGLRVHLRISID